MPARVKDVMNQDVKTVETGETVLQAVAVMNQHEIGSVIVTENESPVGIVTERDILSRLVLKRMDPARTQLHEIMSKPLCTVQPKTTILQAARIMIKRNLKKLVVIDSKGLAGILSLTDMIPLLFAQEATSKLSLKSAKKRVKQVFEIYYDPTRQLRKRCPLTMTGGTSISCIGPKCMWFVKEQCVFLSLAQRT